MDPMGTCSTPSWDPFPFNRRLGICRRRLVRLVLEGFLKVIWGFLDDRLVGGLTKPVEKYEGENEKKYVKPLGGGFLQKLGSLRLLKVYSIMQIIYSLWPIGYWYYVSTTGVKRKLTILLGEEKLISRDWFGELQGEWLIW